MYQFISIYANAREYWVDSQALPLVCFVTALYGAPCICRLSDSQWSYDSCASAISPAVCMQIQYYIGSALQLSVNNQVIRFLIGFDIFEFEPCGKTSKGNIFFSWDLGDLRCECGGSDKFLVILNYTQGYYDFMMDSQ